MDITPNLNGNMIFPFCVKRKEGARNDRSHLLVTPRSLFFFCSAVTSIQDFYTLRTLHFVSIAKYPFALSSSLSALFTDSLFFCLRNLQPKLFQLFFVHCCRRFCHQIGGIFYFRECDHVTDAVYFSHQHDQTIQTIC